MKTKQLDIPIVDRKYINIASEQFQLSLKLNLRNISLIFFL